MIEASVVEYAKETEVRLEETRKLASVKKGEVVGLLVDAVVKCEPHLHRNVAAKHH